jgi:uncharacterized protein (DUF58 family)
MLTRPGVAVAAAGSALLGGAWLTDYPELLVLAFGCLAALAVAALRLLVRTELVPAREIRPNWVSEGEPAFGVMTIANRASRRSPPAIARDVVDGVSVRIPVPGLGPGEEHRESYALPTRRRGVYQVGPMTIAHTDPLRLVAFGRTHRTTSTLYVHPRVHPVTPGLVDRAHAMDESPVGRPRMPGVAFHSLREYEPGEDWRLIHWKSSARLGSPMVRNTTVSDEPRLMVVLDTGSSEYTENSFEEAVSAAASLCLAALGQGAPVELRTTSGDTAVAEQPADGTAILDLLAGVRRGTGDRGLAALADMVPRQASRLCVVTGRRRAAALAVVTAVRPRFLTVSVVLFTEAPGAVDVPGVVAVAVREAAELAAAWHQPVRR